MKPLLCVDFDGVLHSYTSGWKGADVIPDPPTEGAIAWLAGAVEHWRVAIFSSRSLQTGGLAAMQEWLLIHAEGAGWVSQIEWPLEKPAALLTIDDRAVTFTGDWNDFDPLKLRKFQPWNKRDDKIEAPAMPFDFAALQEVRKASD